VWQRKRWSRAHKLPKLLEARKRQQTVVITWAMKQLPACAEGQEEAGLKSRGCSGNPNDEIRMTSSRRAGTRSEANDERGLFRISSCVIDSDFWFRHSDFRPTGASPHSGSGFVLTRQTVLQASGFRSSEPASCLRDFVVYPLFPTPTRNFRVISAWT